MSGLINMKKMRMRGDSMLWIGLGIGAFIGSSITFVIMALCKMSSLADNRAKELYRITYRGDNNGNNQGL